MESPKKVAIETARRLAAQPDLLVAATGMCPELAEPAIQRLATEIERAMARCTCRTFPREG